MNTDGLAPQEALTSGEIGGLRNAKDRDDKNREEIEPITKRNRTASQVEQAVVPGSRCSE